MTTTNRLRSGSTALFAACALLFAACSSEGSETATSELPTLADSPAEESTDSGSGETTPDDDAEDSAAEQNAEVGSTSAGANEPLSDADQERAFAEYERCMADFGIDMNFGNEGDGSTFETTEDVVIGGESEGDASVQFFEGDFDEDFQAAEEACGPILEEAFGSFEMSPEEEAELADAMLEMERCLGEKGYDIDVDGGAFQVDAEDDFEAFDAAMQECNEAAFGEAAVSGTAEAAG